MKDEDIDYSDIPPLDEAFLAQPPVQWPPKKNKPRPTKGTPVPAQQSDKRSFAPIWAGDSPA